MAALLAEIGAATIGATAVALTNLARRNEEEQDGRSFSIAKPLDFCEVVVEGWAHKRHKLRGVYPLMFHWPRSQAEAPSQQMMRESQASSQLGLFVVNGETKTAVSISEVKRHQDLRHHFHEQLPKRLAMKFEAELRQLPEAFLRRRKGHEGFRAAVLVDFDMPFHKGMDPSFVASLERIANDTIKSKFPVSGWFMGDLLRIEVVCAKRGSWEAILMMFVAPFAAGFSQRAGQRAADEVCDCCRQQWRQELVVA